MGFFVVYYESIKRELKRVYREDRDEVTMIDEKIANAMGEYVT